MSDITINNLKDMFANPFYAIQIERSLTDKHEPLISREDWVKVNLRQMTEDDDGNAYECDPAINKLIEEWLFRLLKILEGDYLMEIEES